MNSILDLNNAANVSYNLQSDYQIVFGNSLGNATVVVDRGFDYAVAQQVPITTLANCVRDVLVDFSFPPPPTFSVSSAANVTYTGPYGNIGILKINPTTWRATGIRDINRYDELFANTVVRDGNLGVNYTFTTTVNDQYGNTRTWSTAVTSVGSPTITANAFSYSEDVWGNVGNITIVAANVLSSGTYTLFANADAQYSLVSNGTANATSVTFVGNVTQLNTSLGNLQFLSPPDSSSNIANAVSYNIVRNGTSVANAAQNAVIANTHADYSLVTAVNYQEDTVANLSATITDLDPRSPTYTVTWSQNDPAPGSNAGRFIADAVPQAWGANLVLTGSKATVNAVAVQYEPPSDYTANIVLTYNQVKTAFNGADYTQASNVAVNLTNTGSHAEYSAANFTYWEMYDNPFTITVSDLDANATYTSNIIAVTNTGSANIHAIKVNGNASSTTWANTSRTALRSGTKIDLNAQTLSFRANNNVNLSNVSMAYQQVKSSPDGQTYNQTANSVTINGISTTAHEFTALINTTPRYSIQSSYTYDEDTMLRLVSGTGSAGNVIVTQHPDAGNVTLTEFTAGFYQVEPDPATKPGYFSELGTGYAAFFYANNVPRRPGNIVLINNRNAINTEFTDSAGVRYIPPADYTGNIVLAYYQQQRNTVTNEVVVQAANVNVTMTVGNTHSDVYFNNTVDAKVATPVRFGNAYANLVGVIDVDAVGYKRYAATITVENGTLYAPGGPEWSLVIGNTVSFTDANLITTKNYLNFANGSGSLHWTPTTTGNSNVSISVSRIYPDNVELGNVTVAANVGVPSQGNPADGGGYYGNCTVINGFDAGPYYILLNYNYTSNVSFMPSGSGSFASTSDNDGLAATQYLANVTGLYFQAAAIANNYVGGVDYTHSDWYIASAEEAYWILNQGAASRHGLSGPYWTSTVTAGGAGNVTVIRDDLSTFEESFPTTVQRPMLLVRRIPN